MALLRRIVVSRHIILFLFLVGFVWGITLINFSLQEYNSTNRANANEKIKKQILQLSETYVRNLAAETRSVIDSPYVGKDTGYDLKKTLAVLLQNTLDRLSSLEQRFNLILPNGSYASSNQDASTLLGARPQIDTIGKSISASDLLNGMQEQCMLTKNDVDYPYCNVKMKWMQINWKTDPCYAVHGVDGSDCSFRIYLSEVENYCPILPGRTLSVINATQNGSHIQAVMTYDLMPLLGKLKDDDTRQNYEWIRHRLTRMWPTWVAAGRKLAQKQDMRNRPQKTIILHLGLLTRKSGFHIVEHANNGGPLGELVQWADIIASLYILGHNLTISSEMDQLARLLSTFPSAKSSCLVRAPLPLDLFYTDIVGLTQLKKSSQNGYAKFSCLLRIIDSFGTEPAFNHRHYAKSHRLKTFWGMHELEPQQFFTMFPHSPDNSFMGFVVERHNATNTSQFASPLIRENNAVVYGKALYMWEGKDAYLDIIHKYLNIHGTVFTQDSNHSLLPSYVSNHGILSSIQLQSLLRQSKLFVGLSFPYEGPAPLEAIAQGCVFVNPRFSPPHSSANTKFFKGKPTNRQLTSQHPYTEEFIGPPNVVTVDISDKEAVHEAIKKAIAEIDAGNVQAYLPYEFTQEGMLQRVNFYVQRQYFCSASAVPWMPIEDMSSVLAPIATSCKQACRQKKLLCEPSYFTLLNRESALVESGMTCEKISSEANLALPAYEPSKRVCHLQTEKLLFSCVGYDENLRRLCPCRQYMPGQTALCPNCL